MLQSVQEPPLDSPYESERAPDRDSFWLRYLRDGRPFAEIVEEGIYWHETLDWFSGRGMKGSYGQLSAGKAGRLFQQWLADPERFQKEHSPAFVAAVLEWGQDAEASKARERAAWEEMWKRVPEPPTGYYWTPVHGCFVIIGEVTLRLWSAELGYCPSGGG